MENPKVLIVEDNEADAEVLRDALMEVIPTAQVEVARDGDAALEILNSGRVFDIMFLDLNMPRMNGDELLASMSTQPAGLPSFPIVITTTSDHSAAQLFNQFRFRMGVYMVKPLVLTEYQAALKWILKIVAQCTLVPAAVLKASYEQP